MKEYCTQDKLKSYDFIMTKRQFLKKFGMGMGALGILPLISKNSNASDIIYPHFRPKAKRIIHIFFAGGQSHIDTWDPKPKLLELDGKNISNGLGLASPFKFNKMGKSGIEVSEVFSKTGQFIDDACIIRSLTTEVPAHELATVYMNTGNLRLVRPSLGSWVAYGLGSENENLPAFISLRNGGMPLGGTQNFGAAFLPGKYQATSIDTSLGSIEKMIQNIKNNYTISEQREQIDTLQLLNEMHKQNLQKDSELESRIQSFELAFNMQSEATDAFDISKEPQYIREKYGTGEHARQMLIARRLSERGVRFIQIWSNGWDNHNAIKTSLKSAANKVDQAIAALISDLKERGLLEETLIVMVGEFGRTPARDGEGGQDGYGRSHWHKAMSAVLIGGGIKGGTVYGSTDDIGLEVVENRVDVHDLHATILKSLGYDHEKLNYRYNGRNFRLTDVYGQAIDSIFI